MLTLDSIGDDEAAAWVCGVGNVLFAACCCGEEPLWELKARLRRAIEEGSGARVLALGSLGAVAAGSAAVAAGEGAGRMSRGSDVDSG